MSSSGSGQACRTTTRASFGRHALATALALALALLLPTFAGLDQKSFAQSERTGPSGLALPRFVSLKSDRINVRRGPGRDHEVVWVFVRAGLPVEVVQEFENWRRIRDSEGEEGWVFHSLLSGRRTALIEPWAKDGDPVPAHKKADSDAAVSAFLKPGVLADVYECNGTWCRIGGDGWSGWIDQKRLWGVYPNEVVE